MSLPNYLAKIKSSGIYRYVFDKSLVPPQAAETLRLVVGYSEKGPFNTPVYLDNKADFISLYGNINKRLEKKGVFFHRMALQALSAGPILALNIKPFTKSGGEDEVAEQVQYCAFDPNCIGDWELTDTGAPESMGAVDVIDIFDTNRFWKLDSEFIPKKIAEGEGQIYNPDSGKYINIVATDALEQSCSIFYRPIVPDSYNVTINDWYANSADTELPSYLDDYQDMKLNQFFAEVYVFRGKFTPELVENASGDRGPLYKYFDINEDAEGNKSVMLKRDYLDSFNEEADVLQELSEDPNSKFIAKYEGCLLPNFKDGSNNYISLDILFNSDNGVHKMLMKLDDNKIDDMIEKLNEDSKIVWHTDPETGKVSVSEDFYPAYNPVYIKGYTYNTINKKTTRDEILDKILGGSQDTGMINNKGIFLALTNRVDCEYHYIVDTFASRIEGGCKKALANIAKSKDNAFALLNFPAMSEFTNDKKYYDNNYTPARFDMSRVADSKYGFSLPTEVDGASWCAFYNPIVVGDGTVKNTIPSAALVSNLYMEKWNSRQPYYIVAGPTYGRIQEDGLVGPDYNYSRSDLDVLEPLGTNVIIYTPRKGTYINSNQTAKQVPVTALSKAHVRELVIYLQDEIEMMLQNYQWELNTSTLRDTIKTKADTILEKIAANGGVYAFINICDETNNTPEVIDNEMIILDTSIEPARGAGKMVQRLTIHKTGGISSIAK